MPPTLPYPPKNRRRALRRLGYWVRRGEDARILGHDDTKAEAMARAYHEWLTYLEDRAGAYWLSTSR